MSRADKEWRKSHERRMLGIFLVFVVVAFGLIVVFDGARAVSASYNVNWLAAGHVDYFKAPAEGYVNFTAICLAIADPAANATVGGSCAPSLTVYGLTDSASADRWRSFQFKPGTLSSTTSELFHGYYVNFTIPDSTVFGRWQQFIGCWNAEFNNTPTATDHSYAWACDSVTQAELYLPGTYETQEHANQTWCPFSCVNTAESFTNATAESQTHANATWEGQTHANATWESQAHANATWESQAHANATWESQAHANATWEGQAHANATWCPLPCLTDTSLLEGQAHANATWEGQAHANATWESQAHANATWCPLPCLTDTTLLESQSHANATWEGQVHANATWCPLTGAGCAAQVGNQSGNFTGNFTGNVTIPQNGSLDGVLSYDWTQPFFAGISLAKALIMLVAFAAFIWTSRLHWYEMAAWSWLIIIQQLFIGTSPFGPNATFLALVVLWLVNLFLRVILAWRDEMRQARSSRQHRGGRGD